MFRGTYLSDIRDLQQISDGSTGCVGACLFQQSQHFRIPTILISKFNIFSKMVRVSIFFENPVVSEDEHNRLGEKGRVQKSRNHEHESFKVLP